MRFQIWVACALISVCLVMLCGAANITLSDESHVSTWGLSRKKRYVSFPSGSVLQLGFCLLLPSLIPDGIWYYGVTFGTNWELPTNIFRLKFPKRSAVVHRRDRIDFYQKLLPMLNTLPQSEMANEWEVGGDFMKYDSAHRTKQACWELFPSCFKDVDFY